PHRWRAGGGLLRLSALLPHFIGLHVELVVDGTVHTEVRRRASTAACPACGRRSRRVHSRYTRRITDEPLSGRRVIVHLRVRRFCCLSRGCPKQTFAEQAPALAARYARRSALLRETLEQIGLA